MTETPLPKVNKKRLYSLLMLLSLCTFAMGWFVGRESYFEAACFFPVFISFMFAVVQCLKEDRRKI